MTMRASRRSTVWIGALWLLVFGAAMTAAPARSSPQNLPAVLEGSLLAGPQTALRLEAGGKAVTLSATSSYLLHTLQDERLKDRELRLEGVMKPDGTFEVAHLFTVHNGKLYKVRYYCETCNIAAQEPGPCVCCQKPTELQEIPVGEVTPDMIVVP